MPVRALLAAVSLVTLAACEADATKPPVPTAPSAQQTWMCGREFSNHAWGYQRHGVVLDMMGNIWRYDFKRASGATPWNPNDMAHLTEADLKMRYDGAVVVPGRQVPAPEIEKVFPLVGDAARVKPTEPAPHGADMGQTVTYCYTYDAGTHSYAQVLLDNRGDVDSTNPSQAAVNLRSWLNGWFGDGL